MVIRAKRLIRIGVIVALFIGVGAVVTTQLVNAEGDNNFPNLMNSSDWIVNANSPDPNLTYLYTGGNTDHGKTTHILRNRTLGRNEGTRLRLYYKRAPQTVSVTVQTVACELEANGNFAGRLRVVLGGVEKYDQPTEGKKIDERKTRYQWVLDPGAGPNQRPYVLGYKDDVYDTSDRADTNSPACENFNNNYAHNRYNEGCNDPNAAGTRCQGAGNGTFNKVSSYADDIMPSDGGTFGKKFAVGNKLDGQTFGQAFDLNDADSDGDGKPEMGYDADTRLYYADLDIDLTADADASASNSGADPNMMQRITFNVKGEDAYNGSTWMNARMGYRFFQNEDNAARFFGLQGNGGRNTDYPGYGQKHLLPFGPACDGETKPGKITLYDPDIGGYGQVYMTVFRRNPDTGNVVQLDTYTDLNNLSREQANKVLRSTAGGSGSRSSFEVEMEVGFQYMLAVYNPNQKPPYNNYPSSNVYSIRLPTDSMNGLVNCRYDLSPRISNVKSTYNAYGDTLSGIGSIINSNDEAATGDHNWKISKVVYASRPSDLSRPGQEDSSITDPCSFARDKSGTYKSCNADVFNGTYPATDSSPFNESVGPDPIGTYVCYFTSVANPTWREADNNQRRYSVMMCSVAGVKPKLQVWGGDVKSGSTINTSLTQTNGGMTYGSWGEYGVASNGRNVGMASGSGLLGGDSNNQSDWSALTFSNSNPFVLGNFGGVMPLAYTPPSSTEANCSLGARAYGANEKAVIQCAGTLTITGPQTFAANYSSISAIPNIKIIADNIVIAAGVDRIDPWLIARSGTGTYGSISTCDQVPGFLQHGALNGALLNGTKCGVPIKFNGPVIADKLYLYRTHDEQTGNVAAETFNLRADNILSSYNGSGVDQPVARTELITELPPRF